MSSGYNSPAVDRALSVVLLVETHLDTSQRSLYLFLFSCAFNPLFWNIAARLEYHHRILTRTVGCGSRYVACYFLAASIFSLGLVRDYLYKLALDNQPDFATGMANATMYSIIDPIPVPLLNAIVLAAYVVGCAAMVAGNVLVLSSMWRLGVTGTYLGDYFGILMSERVVAFPFNIMDNPMYNGSTLIFLGTGLVYGKIVASILLSIFVLVSYQVAITFEGPFTAQIYARHHRQEKSQEQTRKSQ